MTPHILVLVSVNRLWSFGSGEREPNPRNHQNVPIMKKKTQTPCYKMAWKTEIIWFVGFTENPSLLIFSPRPNFSAVHPHRSAVVSRDLFSFEWELLTMCRRLEVTKANKNIWECKSLKFYAVQIPPWIKVQPLVIVVLCAPTTEPFILTLSPQGSGGQTQIEICT